MGKKEGVQILLVCFLLLIIPLSLSYSGNSTDYDVAVTDISSAGYEETSQPNQSFEFDMQSMPSGQGLSGSYNVSAGFSRTLGPIAFDVNITPSNPTPLSILNCTGYNAFADIAMPKHYYRYTSSGGISTNWSESGELNCTFYGCVTGEDVICHFKVDDSEINSTEVTKTVTLGNITCTNCSDCSNKIQSARGGSKVLLNESIQINGTICINFNGADNITFDCQGNQIWGNRIINTYGIFLPVDSDRNKISNCQVYNFSRGVFLNYSDYNNLENITSNYNNITGIQLAAANYINLSNITADWNMYGFSIGSSTNISASFLNADNNSNTGFNLGAAYNSTFIGIHASSNRYDGFFASTCSQITVKDSVFQENGFDANVYPSNNGNCNNIFENITGSGGRMVEYYNSSSSIKDKVLSQLILCNADNSNLSNITIIGSETLLNNGIIIEITDGTNISGINSSENNYGIIIEKSYNNTLSDITVNFNNKSGIFSPFSSNNNFSNVEANYNFESGIYLSYANNYNILNSQTNFNNYGAVLWNSHRNNLTNIEADSNALNGIYISTASNNTLSAISASSNSQYGLVIYANSDNNTIAKSIIENNTIAGLYLDKNLDPEYNTIYDNIFNNSLNIMMDSGILSPNYLNTSLSCVAGANIIGGQCIGGNFWTNPAGSGFSDTCSDSDENGICDNFYNASNGTSVAIDYLPLTHDRTAPRISVQIPQDGATYASHNISLNFTATDAHLDKCWLVNSTGGTINLPGCANTTFNAIEGYQNITVYSNDTAGNTNSTQVFFTTDTTPPLLLDHTAYNVTGQSAMITTTINENGTVLLEYGDTILLGTNITNSTIGETHYFFLPGLINNTDYFYNMTFTDIYGNSIEYGTYNFTTGKVPIIYLVSPDNDATWNQSIKIIYEFNATDDQNLSSCQLILNSVPQDAIIISPQQNITLNITAPTLKGKNEWQIKCTNEYGASGYSEKRNITQEEYDDFYLTNIGATGFNETNPDYTYTKMVILNFQKSMTATQCRYKNEGDAWSSFESCQQFKYWNLQGADGNKTVYAEINHSGGIDDSLVTNLSDWIILESEGTHLDITPPGGFSVYDDGEFSNNNESFHANWDVPNDPETNILLGQITFSYIIIDKTTGQNITSWAYSGTQTEIDVQGLFLEEGHNYSINVSATNQANLTIYSSSDGIIIDTTKPIMTSVSSNPKNLTWSNNNSLFFNWTATDNLSGASGYSMILDKSNGTEPDTAVEGDYNENRTYQDKQEGTYYFHIRPNDNAQNWGDTFHYGPIMLDLTPPTPAIPENQYQYAESTNITFYWYPSQDALSGVSFYNITIYDANDTGINYTYQTTEINYTFSMATQGHTYYIIIISFDEAGNTASSEAPSGNVLQILSSRPSGGTTVKTGPIVRVLTSKEAVCEENYTNKEFLFTNSTYHETRLNQEDGVYSLKIICEDEEGTADSATISYEVDSLSMPPSVTLGSVNGSYRGQIMSVSLTAGAIGQIAKNDFVLALGNETIDDFTLLDNNDAGSYTLQFVPRTAGTQSLKVTVLGATDSKDVDIKDLKLLMGYEGVSAKGAKSRLVYSDFNNKKMGLASDSSAVDVLNGSDEISLNLSSDGRAYIFFTRELNAESRNTFLENRDFSARAFGYPADENFRIMATIGYNSLILGGLEELPKGTYSIFLKNTGQNNKNQTVLKMEIE